MGNRIKHFLVISPSKKYLKRADKISYAEKNYYERIKLKGDIYSYYNGDKSAYIDDWNYCVELNNRIISELKNTLNEHCNVSFDTTSWNFLFGSWMMNLLFNLHNKYMKIKECDADATCFEKDLKFQIHNTTDIITMLANEDDFNSYLYMEICKKMGINVCNRAKLSYIETIIDRIKARFVQLKNPGTIKRWLSKAINMNNSNKSQGNILVDSDNMVLNEDTQYVFIRSYIRSDIEKRILEDCKTVERIDTDRIIAYENNIPYVDLNYEFRSSLKREFNSQTEFEELAIDVICKLIPTTILENFNIVYAKACEIIGDSTPKKLYESSFTGDPLADMFFAVLHQKGTIMYAIQHSGAYGIHRFARNVESVLFDRFITWGWNDTDEDYCELIPGVINRLPQIQKKEDVECDKNRILIVAAVRGMYECGSGACYDELIERHLKFIDNLSEEKKRHVTLRISHWKTCDTIREIYKEKYPYVEIELIKETPFTDSVLSSGIVVCDYNSSSVIETALLGRPVVFFDGLQYVSINKSVADELEPLKEVGIYRVDGEDMAEMINEIDDYEVWWDDEKKLAMNNYIKYASGTEDEVYEFWRKELNG